MKIRRVVFAGLNRVEVDEVETDVTPASKQMVVRTVCSMVSQGTELAALTGTHSRAKDANPPAWLKFPSVPGYLAVGEVVEIGSEVKTFAAGDRVIVEGNGCWNSHASTIVAWESEWVTKIPAGVAYDEAVMSKLASVAMYGVRILHHEFGETVAIFGLGVVGQLAARFCSLAGFREVVAADPIGSRREVAATVPGVTVVAPDDARVGEAMAARSRTDGYDNVIEASGHPSGFAQALNVARIRGKIAVPSAPHQFVPIRLYDQVMHKSLQILGAHGSSQPSKPTVCDQWTEPRQKEWFLQLVARKRIEVKSIVSHRLSWSDAPAAYAGLLERPAEYLGVVFEW